MPIHRQALGSQLARAGVLRSMQAAVARGRTHLLILAYHRIMPKPLSADYPYDFGLLSATPEDFAWQMRYIADHCHPVSGEDLHEYLRGKRELPKRPVMVTFDDGFHDNYRNAFPILKSAGVPALFFLTTGHIGTNKVFWFQRAYFLAYRCAIGAIKLPGHDRAMPEGDDVSSRERAARALLKYLKSVPQARV